MALLTRKIASTPFIVIDVETTGLSSKHDRVVELAAVLVKGRDAPAVVLDTLVNPGIPVGESVDIHGITDDDLKDAPRFDEISTVVRSALAGRVVVSHNVYFDLGMLFAELGREGGDPVAPHLCSMLLGKVLKIDPQLSLGRAAVRAGIEGKRRHIAVEDALTAAELLQLYIRRLLKDGIHTFADLRAAFPTQYKFLDSFVLDPMPPPRAFTSSLATSKSRSGAHKAIAKSRSALAEYRDLVLNVVADLIVDEDETEVVRCMQRDMKLTGAEIRAVHGQVFAAMLNRFLEDGDIETTEIGHLRRLASALQSLGWSPGGDWQRL